MNTEEVLARCWASKKEFLGKKQRIIAVTRTKINCYEELQPKEAILHRDITRFELKEGGFTVYYQGKGKDITFLCDRREDILTHLKATYEDQHGVQLPRFPIHKVTRKGERYDCILAVGSSRLHFISKPASHHDTVHDLRQIVEIKKIVPAEPPGALEPTAIARGLVLTLANHRKYRFDSEQADNICHLIMEGIKSLGLTVPFSQSDHDGGEPFMALARTPTKNSKVFEMTLEKECRSHNGIELRPRSLVIMGAQVLERDPATHRTLACHDLSEIWSIVRYTVGGAPPIVLQEREASRETPVTLSSNNGQYWPWIQPAETAGDLRLGSRQSATTDDMEAYCINRITNLIQLQLQRERGSPVSPDMWNALLQYNTNVPLGACTCKERRLPLQLIDLLRSAGPALTPYQIVLVLQTLQRLFTSRRIFEGMGELAKPIFAHVYPYLLSPNDSVSLAAAFTLHAAVSSYTKQAVSNRSLPMALPHGANPNQTVDGGAPAPPPPAPQPQQQQQQPQAAAPSFGDNSPMVLMVLLDMLTCMAHGRDLVAPSLLGKMYNVIIELRDAFFQLARGRSFYVSECASLLLKCAMENAGQSLRIMQDSARSSGALLIQLIRALEPASVNQEQLRTSGNPETETGRRICWELGLGKPLLTHFALPPRSTSGATSGILAAYMIHHNDDSVGVLQRIVPPALYQMPFLSSLGSELRKDYIGYVLLWHDGARRELAKCLRAEIEAYDSERFRFPGVPMLWNHHEFEVRYETLEQEIPVGRYYLLQLEKTIDSVKLEKTIDSVKIEDPRLFMQQLFGRMLRADPHSPPVVFACLRIMEAVYSRYWREIGCFEFMHHIMRLLEDVRPPNVAFRDHLIRFLTASILHPANVKVLVDGGGLQVLLFHLCFAHLVNVPEPPPPVGPDGAAAPARSAPTPPPSAGGAERLSFKIEDSPYKGFAMYAAVLKLLDDVVSAGHSVDPTTGAVLSPIPRCKAILSQAPANPASGAPPQPLGPLSAVPLGRMADPLGHILGMLTCADGEVIVRAMKSARAPLLQWDDGVVRDGAGIGAMSLLSHLIVHNTPIVGRLYQSGMIHLLLYAATLCPVAAESTADILRFFLPSSLAAAGRGEGRRVAVQGEVRGPVPGDPDPHLDREAMRRRLTIELGKCLQSDIEAFKTDPFHVVSVAPIVLGPPATPGGPYQVVQAPARIPYPELERELYLGGYYVRLLADTDHFAEFPIDRPESLLASLVSTLPAMIPSNLADASIITRAMTALFARFATKPAFVKFEGASTVLRALYETSNMNLGGVERVSLMDALLVLLGRIIQPPTQAANLELCVQQGATDAVVAALRVVVTNMRACPSKISFTLNDGTVAGVPATASVTAVMQHGMQVMAVLLTNPQCRLSVSQMAAPGLAPLLMFAIDHLTGPEGAPVVPPGYPNLDQLVPAAAIRYARWDAGLRGAALPCVLQMCALGPLQEQLYKAGCLHRLMLMLLDNIAEAEAPCLRHMGGGAWAGLQTPENDFIKQTTSYMLTPGLYKHLRSNGSEAEFLATMSQTHQTAHLLWTPTTRRELAAYCRAAIDSPDSYCIPLAQPPVLTFSEIAYELQVDGMFLRYYNAAPSPVADPLHFVGALVAFLRDQEPRLPRPSHFSTEPSAQCDEAAYVHVIAASIPPPWTASITVFSELVCVTCTRRDPQWTWRFTERRCQERSHAPSSDPFIMTPKVARALERSVAQALEHVLSSSPPAQASLGIPVGAAMPDGEPAGRLPYLLTLLDHAANSPTFGAALLRAIQRALTTPECLESLDRSRAQWRLVRLALGAPTGDLRDLALKAMGSACVHKPKLGEPVLTAGAVVVLMALVSHALDAPGSTPEATRRLAMYLLLTLATDPATAQQAQSALGHMVPRALGRRMVMPRAGAQRATEATAVEMLQLYDGTWENPELIWNPQLRAQLQSALKSPSPPSDTHRDPISPPCTPSPALVVSRSVPASDVLMSRTLNSVPVMAESRDPPVWSVDDFPPVRYGDLDRERQVMGIFLGPFLAQPAWPFDEPLRFLEALMIALMENIQAPAEERTVLYKALQLLLANNPELVDSLANPQTFATVGGAAAAAKFVDRLYEILFAVLQPAEATALQKLALMALMELAYAPALATALGRNQERLKIIGRGLTELVDHTSLLLQLLLRLARVSSFVQSSVESGLRPQLEQILSLDGRSEEVRKGAALVLIAMSRDATSGPMVQSQLMLNAAFQPYKVRRSGQGKDVMPVLTLMHASLRSPCLSPISLSLPNLLVSASLIRALTILLTSASSLVVGHRICPSPASVPPPPPLGAGGVPPPPPLGSVPPPPAVGTVPRAPHVPAAATPSPAPSPARSDAPSMSNDLLRAIQRGTKLRKVPESEKKEPLDPMQLAKVGRPVPLALPPHTAPPSNGPICLNHSTRLLILFVPSPVLQAREQGTASPGGGMGGGGGGGGGMGGLMGDLASTLARRKKAMAGVDRDDTDEAAPPRASAGAAQLSAMLATARKRQQQSSTDDY
ncbi:putative CRE-RME-8 protein [Paratrimastix pyriformis]|uniref:CRE-RME-8 protein n=1 Tax=Paratrimastix pyriformis TaxID=342808 RepID=A0ABQ8UXX0_9EUKA|nr:putative CRE-RME-8 protein [Paratrimastix pyriformis]